MADIIIWGKYRGINITEKIDTAPDQRTADYLVREYQMAYGHTWQVWSGKKSGKKGDNK